MKYKDEYKDRMKQIGQRIKEVRTQRGMSKTELLRAIGGSTNTGCISQYENGHGMNVCTLMAIADALGVPESALLESGEVTVMHLHPHHVDVAFLTEPRFELRMDFELVSK